MTTARLSTTEKRAVQSQKLAAVIAADPRLRANDAARRGRDDAAMLSLKSQAKRTADAKARAKASMTDAERERVRMKARREREADKRRAVREAAAEKLKAAKGAARKAVKQAAASAKRSLKRRADAAAAQVAKAEAHSVPVPELMTDEMAEWDGEVPW